jgi:hypothetical protein
MNKTMKADSTQPIAAPGKCHYCFMPLDDVAQLHRIEDCNKFLYGEAAVFMGGARMSIEERALDYVERRGLIYSRQHPTDQQALEQEQAEKALAQRITDFAKSEFPREREEAVRQFARTMHSRLGLDEYRMRALIAEVFTELFNKPL